MDDIENHKKRMIAFAKKKIKAFPGKVKVGQRTYKVDTRKEDIRICEYKEKRFELIRYANTPDGLRALIIRFDRTWKGWVDASLIREETYEEKASKSTIGVKKYRKYYKE